MVDTPTLIAPAPTGAGNFFRSPAPRLRPALPIPAPASRRHLLGLEGMPAAHILELLEGARAWRQRWRLGRVPRETLSGVEVCNAFFEDSTRTRLSFELAERRLGATTDPQAVDSGLAGGRCGPAMPQRHRSPHRCRFDGDTGPGDSHVCTRVAVELLATALG